MNIYFEKIFNIAFDYAADTLSRQDFTTPQSVHLDTDEIQRQLSTATREIKAAIGASANSIIEKLESDKHEELISKIQNIALVIRINDRGEILHSLMDMRISLDYAENRVAEGKIQWQPALIMGKAAEYAALSVCLSDTIIEKTELHKILSQAKYSFLDVAVPSLLSNKCKMNWGRLAEFVNSNNHGVKIAELLRVDEEPKVDAQPEEEDIIASDSWWPSNVPNDHQLRVFSVMKRAGEVLASDALIATLEFKSNCFEIRSGRGESLLVKLYVNDGSYVRKGEKIARVKRKM